MVNGITWLLVCQLVGEVVVHVTGLPVPGPVVGMLLLFVALLVVRPGEDAGVARTADALLRHLQLFFVPAGVGVVVYLSALREHALAVTVGLAGSWLLGLLAVGWLLQLWLGRRQEETP